MKTFFKELFKYNHHFNQELAEAVIKYDSQFPQHALQLFNHLVNAQTIWNSRLIGEKAQIDVWDIHPIEELKTLDKQNYQNSLDLVVHASFDQPVTYTNSKGLTFTNSVRDMLFHIANHATHHRGQIVLEMRQQGLEPPVTDYIFYRR
ncbi:MAG: DinB family protein [Bacteroidota bacterium]